MRIFPTKHIQTQQVQLFKKHGSRRGSQNFWYYTRMQEHSIYLLVPCYFIHLVTFLFLKSVESQVRMVCSSYRSSYTIYRKAWDSFSSIPKRRPSHCLNYRDRQCRKPTPVQENQLTNEMPYNIPQHQTKVYIRQFAAGYNIPTVSIHPLPHLLIVCKVAKFTFEQMSVSKRSFL